MPPCRSRPHPLELQEFDDGLREKFLSMLQTAQGRTAICASGKRVHRRRVERTPTDLIPHPHDLAERTGFRVITRNRHRQSPTMTYFSTLMLAITSGLLIGAAFSEDRLRALSASLLQPQLEVPAILDKISAAPPLYAYVELGE